MEYVIDRLVPEDPPPIAAPRIKTREWTITGVHLVVAGIVILLGSVLPALYLAVHAVDESASVVGETPVPDPVQFVYAIGLAFTGIVAGGPILIMGLVKFAREVWKP